ncbi:S41 family peptidase [Patescibacteria group bacterium]
MRVTIKKIRAFFLILALLFLAGGIGYRWGERGSFRSPSITSGVRSSRQSPMGGQQLDFSLFWEVWDRLESTYLGKESLSSQDMVYGAISGLVASLGDPYSVFLTPEQNSQAGEDLAGSFGGIGIQLGYLNRQLAVIAPLKGTPAEKAGVKARDLILKIGDLETLGLSLPEAVKLIRGPKGEAIRLTMLHQGEKASYEVEIIREMIEVPSVALDFHDNCQQNQDQCSPIAKITLSRFGDNTAQEWLTSVGEILEKCQPLSSCQGVVLDLRNNPGGYLESSVYVASEFLSSGVVVQQEEVGGQRQGLEVNREGSLLEIPLVVLINQGSASASEIVAGALKEQQRAILVGDDSFGKGSIQEAQELPGGAGLHITTARWLLPSGQSVDVEGLKPNIYVQNDPEGEEDNQLNRAIEILREK